LAAEIKAGIEAGIEAGKAAAAGKASSSVVPLDDVVYPVSERAPDDFPLPVPPIVGFLTRVICSCDPSSTGGIGAIRFKYPMLCCLAGAAAIHAPALACFSSWPLPSQIVVSAFLLFSLTACGFVSHRHMLESPSYADVKALHIAFVWVTLLLVLLSASAAHVMVTVPSQKADSKRVRDVIRNREFLRRLLPLLVVLTCVTFLFFFTCARQCASMLQS
jgi:hypothetical protein